MPVNLLELNFFNPHFFELLLKKLEELRHAAALMPECVVRSCGSRVRRPLPVRVIIAGPPGFRVVGG